LPTVAEAHCSQCGANLSDPPRNVTEVPNQDPLLRALEAVRKLGRWCLVLVLLLVMAGFVYAFVESFGEKDPALLVLLALVIVGCGVLVCIAVRRWFLAG
jgi:hypothetical protein